MLALVLTSSSAWAQSPRNATLRDFHHTAWTQKDGAPAGVWAMAQTRDGWLWLGTASGLYRFDGVHFERRDLLPPESIASRSVGVLQAMRNGDLWVAYSFGGASVLRASGEVRHFDPGGLPEGKPVESFDEDGDGRPWALTPLGLHVFEGGVWSHVDVGWGLPEDEWADSLQDVSGALWLVGSSGVYVLRPNAQRFERVETDGPPVLALFLGHDGTLLRYDEQGTSPLRGPGFPEPLAHVPADAWSSHALISVFDRDGSGWLVGCPQGGICRRTKPFEEGRFLRRTEATDVFGAREGLSSDAAMTLFLDREGNIWVGTQLGLDRFRRNDVATLRFPKTTSYFALVADRRGRLWSGSAMRVGTSDVWWRLDASPLLVPGIQGEMTATFLDSDGRLLLGGSSGFWRFDPEDSRVETLSRPEQEQGQRIQAIVRDAEGRLWVSFRASTVYRLDGDTWTPKGGLAALPDLPPARAVLDGEGHLWFGYNNNQVVFLEGAHVRSFTEQQGLRTGTVTAILPGAPTLVGGALGLAAFDGARFQMLKATHAEVLTGITGLLKTEDGALWLNGQAGGARIAAEDLRRGLTEPGFMMPIERFDMNDGMPGGAQQIRPLPTLVQGGDGRLWFAAVNGLGWMDPSRIERNALPPPVMIRSVSSGETSYVGTTRLELPPRTRELRIAYTALSLGMPERVTFRYRLEGVDEGWKDAGARREATYTNLGPGHYRFQVMAANEDGVWNERGASLELDIAPTFFQTRAFAVLCVVGAVGLLWLLYALRMWRVTQRLRLRLEERHAERERIARELHDTLLQGIQGLVLNVHVVTSSLPVGDARLGLESALDRADSVLTEGRDRVSSLRDTSASKDDLAEAFTSLARELDEREGPRLRMVVRGEARTLEPLVADELYRIGREAIGNAFVHSRAREVEVSLLFEHPELRLCVRDDGRGIDVATLERGGRAGHWGLRGMRERAEKVGGRLDIISGEGRGTEVHVVVQAQRAYLRRPLEGLRRLVPRLGRR
ncbi:histidine kinase [Myxococcus sp. K38C18041901]|uniref:sensor histidine kinase n=1 Tax=Myxococcus guangdongensis TaxID=2906760 RepID=UPI0020A7D3E4|nr:two-component regulator propeller domain-containing protein [Myxococcus guangdongensis]MCP3058174.1 histidine kinase [Myxococcus guangdongensis]